MLEAGLIAKASPSTVNAIRQCGLAVYRRRSRTAGGNSRPSNPPARLGSAVHSVLEWIANNAAALAREPGLEAEIRAKWSDVVSREQEAARAQPREQATGPIGHWPRFAQIQEHLVIDGKALAKELAGLPPESVWAERELTNEDGDLGGIIDLVLLGEGDTATVIDHKVGKVTPEDVAPGGRYATQLLLYAALVRDAGLRPEAAEIRPLGGKEAFVEVSDQAIDNAVEAARTEMATYNSAVHAGTVKELAVPSEQTCQWCEFLLDCSAIWVEPPPDLGDLIILQGTVVGIEKAASGRIAVQLETTNGQIIVTGLSESRVPTLRDLKSGDEVRIVGLTQSGTHTYRVGAGRLDVVRLSDLGQETKTS